jgi:predicted AAA+ superfamily ATPase
MINRYLEKYILEDIKDKMVFISGPRQVGKTTLANQIGNNFFPQKTIYLNWDNREDRKMILAGAFPSDKTLFIFDEIHKYRNWKNYLKGEFDKYKDKFHFLVTGSARLDIYKKGGDSLHGRYHSYKLHPLSSRELSGDPIGEFRPFEELIFKDENGRYGDLLKTLFTFGGFPELVVKQSEKELRRWHNERADRLIKEDIRDIENIRDLSALQLLVELLPSRVGSLFSVNSLREDLSVTHKTVALWVDILEKFYYHFRVYPFQSTRIKSLRKEPKLYLWDWSEIQDESVRFENIIASHLLKFCSFLQDVEGYKAGLFYLRDKEQREVDFAVTINNKPWFCVEVKSSYKSIPSALTYFSQRLKIPYRYIAVRDEGVDLLKDGTRVISTSKFLTAFV